MAFVLADRVKQASSSTGTGDFHLNGDIEGFQSFISGVGNGNTTEYVIDGGSEVEIGAGTVIDGNPPRLQRDTVKWSTNSNSLVNFSAGTKVVFCSPQSDVHKICYPFPAWDNWTSTSWSETALALDTNKRGTYDETIVSLGAVGSYRGAVAAPNGCIYFIPYDATTVLKIDPVTDTMSTFGSLSGTNKWAGGVLAENGMIYGMPFDSTTVLKIDPSTDSATTFGSLAGSNKWQGGVLAPNGMVYGIPEDSTTVLKIDPTTDTATTFGSLAVGVKKWTGGVLTPSGMIYGMSYGSGFVLKINPTTDTTTEFDNQFGTDIQMEGGVIAPNGMIYGLPYDPIVFAKIDYTADAITYVNISSSILAGSYGYPRLLPNGKIFIGGVIINPETDTVQLNSYVTVYTSCLSMTGSLYYINESGPTLNKIRITSRHVDKNFVLSRYFNKL